MISTHLRRLHFIIIMMMMMIMIDDRRGWIYRNYDDDENDDDDDDNSKNLKREKLIVPLTQNETQFFLELKNKKI